MHLCLQEQVPWAIGDGRTKGCLKYPLSAAYEEGVFGMKEGACNSFIRDGVSGRAGDAIQSGGPFEDGFYEMLWGLLAKGKCWCLHCNGPGCPANGEDETGSSGSVWRLVLLRVWLFLHPCVTAGHEMAQSEGTFQRHFSNSHYPQCKDGPGFSSAWLLFRPEFQSSIDACFQLKEEGG